MNQNAYYFSIIGILTSTLIEQMTYFDIHTYVFMVFDIYTRQGDEPNDLVWFGIL